MLTTHRAVRILATMMILMAVSISGCLDNMAPFDETQVGADQLDMMLPDSEIVPGSVFDGMIVDPDGILINDARIPDRYIVQFKDERVIEGSLSPLFRAQDMRAASKELLRTNDIKAQIFHVYSNTIKGFAAKMGRDAAVALANDPNVKLVEQDSYVYASTTQYSAPWGLDRIDQSSLPLNSQFTYTANGAGVHAYIIDTGILRSHSQFSGRVQTGADKVSVSDGQGDGIGGITTGCGIGHGTHVAGTIGGSTYGIAKQVTLHSVRVLNCEGSGSMTDVIAGVEWVQSNRVMPAVINMSLGGSASTTLDAAVNAAINSGISVVVAAGNENVAVTGSPARINNAITVASTENDDDRSSFSNYGYAVDVFAPGTNILSALNTSTSASGTMSGTSMASPHVAGVVALYLQGNGDASPATVFSAVVNGAVTGKVDNAGTGSPNKLLQVIGSAPPTVACGDDLCNGTEDCSSCPGDCGACGTGGDCDDLVVTGLGGGFNTFHRYIMNGTNITASTDGQTGDWVHLYVKLGSDPDRLNYDCKSDNYDADESLSCSGTGEWHILVWGNGVHDGVSLNASLSSCSDDGSTAPDPYCGDNNCDTGETCSNCAVDCGTCDPYCGDGSCNGDETCSSCSSDCGACPASCGDGTCDSNENCENCPADCGECADDGGGSCEDISLSGLDGAFNSYRRYEITGSNAVVETVGSYSQFARLYVKLGSPPVPTAYIGGGQYSTPVADCIREDMDDGSNHTCNMSGSGVWHILIYGKGSYSGVSLDASVETCATAY